VRVVIQHRSRYHYPRPALLGPQLIRLRLAPTPPPNSVASTINWLLEARVSRASAEYATGGSTTAPNIRTASSHLISPCSDDLPFRVSGRDLVARLSVTVMMLF
jgi:hypothetical protein